MIIKEIEKPNQNKDKKQGNISRKISPYLFLIPHLIFFLVFVVYPFFYGIILSFFDYNLINSPSFVGFNNYIQIFTFGSKFSNDFFLGLGHTALFTVVVIPLIIIVPLLFAVWLFAIKNAKIRNIFQAILYATSILSVATVVWIWRWMLDRENGLINNIIQSNINWRGTQPLAWISIFLLTLWAGVGGNMIIFLSAISSIPQSQYEAASLDGANAWHKLIHITIPSLKFPLTYCLITGVIGGFNVFGQPYLFGGPTGTYETLMMNIQRYGFGGSDLPMAGMASAMSVLLGLIILVVSVIQFRLMRGKEK